MFLFIFQETLLATSTCPFLNQNQIEIAQQLNNQTSSNNSLLVYPFQIDNTTFYHHMAVVMVFKYTTLLEVTVILQFYWFGVLGIPSLKTALDIYSIENQAALSNTGSNPLPISVKLYSTLIGYSDTILLLIIPTRSSSRRRSVRTFGDMPFMFSRKRLNCVLPLRISLMI